MREHRTNRGTPRFAGPLLAALIVAATAQTPPPAPSVTLAFGSPAYTLAASCDVAQPLATISVLATNHGAAPAAFAVTAIDQRGTLGGGSPVPAVAPGATVPVTIPLRRVGYVVPSTLAGTHVIDVTVRAVGARPIELQLPFPATLCPVTGSISSRDPHRPIATTPPGINTTGIVSEKDPVRVAAFAIAPPTNVRSVASGTDCGTHVGAIGALVCPDMMKSGDLLLIWDWQPGAGAPAIDGYRVYRVGRGAGTGRVAEQLLTTQTNKGQTLFDVPKLRGGAGYDGSCYAVTAYAGNRESARSTAFCAGGSSAATTVRLAPAHQRHSLQQRNKGSYGVADTDSARIYVGFMYSDAKRITGDTFSNVFYRGAVAFDLSRVSGHRLVSARLRLGMLSSDGAGAQHSCTTDIGTGVAAWWQNAGWIDGQFAQGVEPTDLGPEVTADVTPIVAGWLGGQANFGFVLKNADENLAAFTNKICLTKYGDPALEVVYY